MRDLDTDIGGRAGGFPTTTWERISLASGCPTNTDRARLESFCRRYWKPIFWHILATWHKSSQDAKDLTQAFFLWLLEGNALEKYVPDRGSFRGYLKVVLKGYMGHHEEALRTLKRGGGVKTLSLDDDTSALEKLVAGSDSHAPDRIFDQMWLEETIRHALERVRLRLEAEGRSVQYRVYEQYELVSPDDRPTYAALATRLGLTEDDVRNYLSTVRQEIRSEVRLDLADQTSDDDALRSEWNDLFPS